ncbi:anthrone oxygenase family protein [Allostreptomyces psammosilenae]|uniref:Putative membrane protein n=1 Tax=Allostreptomyces psammosilenae TaxID=1892865 RepID=A0A852ZVV5_9ACTN|nr:anthrone oxygenase family protein [Allostreptomyces psammosilenae]NYI06359.1 putative membrane protein [Allostreptomyces psammosilenae]
MTGQEFLRGAALMAATLTMGLVAGLFHAFAMSVMPGLGRADDRTFVVAMGRINVAILNGWFAVTFGGALLLTALAVLAHLGGGARPALPWIVAALLLYAVMLAVTFGVNVPLNNALAAVGEPGSLGAAELAEVRERFEARWVRWNVVRAVAATAGFGCLAWALVLHGRGLG